MDIHERRWTPPQLAEFLCISSRTVERWCDYRGLACDRPGPRSPRRISFHGLSLFLWTMRPMHEANLSKVARRRMQRVADDEPRAWEEFRRFMGAEA